MLFAFFGMIVLFILIWKPLRRRFSGWALLLSLLLFSLAEIAAVIAIAEPWLSESLLGWSPLFAQS